MLALYLYHVRNRKMASPGDEDEIIKAGPSGVNLIPRIHLGLPKITEEGKQ